MFDSIRAEVVQSTIVSTTEPSAPISTSHRRSTMVETESVQSVLTPEEEKKVMELIVERAELGCGMVLCCVRCRTLSRRFSLLPLLLTV